MYLKGWPFSRLKKKKISTWTVELYGIKKDPESAGAVIRITGTWGRGHWADEIDENIAFWDYINAYEEYVNLTSVAHVKELLVRWI